MARQRAPHWQIRLRETSVVSSGTTDSLDERLSSVWLVVTGVERMDTQQYAAKQWKTRFVEEWRGRPHLEVSGRRTQDTEGERAAINLQFADRRAAPLLSSSASCSSTQQWVPPQGTARDTLMSGGADMYRTRLREGQRRQGTSGTRTAQRSLIED